MSDRTVPERPPPVEPSAFRRLMARWATGVSVVTARDGPVDGGLTVNAFLSVALAPPSVLVSLTLDADTTPLIERSRHFAVNLLAADQRPLSERFARTVPSEEKFRDVPVHRGPMGLALLDGSLASFECQVADWMPRYDHVLVLGEVVHAEAGPEREPLIFFRSTYSTPDGTDRLRLPPRPPA